MNQRIFMGIHFKSSLIPFPGSKAVFLCYTHFMKAVILCAGRGERLMPLTENTPKPLLKISNKPILFYILNSLPEIIDKTILVIQEKDKAKFESFLHEYDFKNINFVYQDEERKGTYFALIAAKDLLQDEEKFLVLNGDDIFKKNDLVKLITSCAPVYGLGYKQMDGRYRTCDLDEKNMKILSFRRQTEEELKRKTPCFSGAFVLTQEFFSYEPVYVNEEAGIPHTLFGSDVKVFFVFLSNWIQINTTKDLEDAKLF